MKRDSKFFYNPYYFFWYIESKRNKKFKRHYDSDGYMKNDKKKFYIKYKKKDFSRQGFSLDNKF